MAVEATGRAATSWAGAAGTGGSDRDHDDVRAALGWAMQSGEAEVGLRLGVALRGVLAVGSQFHEGVRWLDDLLGLPAASERTRLASSGADRGRRPVHSRWAREEYLRRAQEAITIYREIGDEPESPMPCGELGVARMSAGHLGGGARRRSVKRETATSAIGDLQKAGECTVALSFVAIVCGRPSEAHVNTWKTPSATFAQLGDPFWSAFTERWVGWLDQREGEEVSAEQRYRSSLMMARTYDILLVVAMGPLRVRRPRARAWSVRTGAVPRGSITQTIRDRIGEAPSPEMVAVGDVRAKALGFVDEGATAESAYQKGRVMDIDEAVAYALDDPAVSPLRTGS